MGTTFSCFTTDDRSTVETFTLWTARDADDAWRLANKDLLENSHHQAIEVWDGEQMLFVLRRDDLRPPASYHFAAACSPAAG